MQDLQNQGTDSETPSIILIGRESDDSWWNEAFPGLKHLGRFTLDPLSLSEAINYAHAILQQSGVDTTRWDHKDTNFLEQLTRLMQFNPLALQAVLSLEARDPFPWKQY